MHLVFYRLFVLPIILCIWGTMLTVLSSFFNNMFVLLCPTFYTFPWCKPFTNFLELLFLRTMSCINNFVMAAVFFLILVRRKGNKHAIYSYDFIFSMFF
jgi:hypothetical protein